MGKPVLIALVLALLVTIGGVSYLAGGVKGARSLSDQITSPGLMSLAEEYQRDQLFLQERYAELEEVAASEIILNSGDGRPVGSRISRLQDRMFLDDPEVQAIFKKWGYGLPIPSLSVSLPPQPLWDDLLSQ